MNLDALMTYAALIGALLAMWVAWKKTPFESAQLDASAAKAYAEAAESAAERTEAAEKKLAAAIEQIDGLKCRIDKLNTEFAQLKIENDKMRVGVERLLAQMRAHEITPVWKPEAANS